MNLYNLKTTELGFRITKFSMDLDMESSYNIQDLDGKTACDCPQGHKPTCRHRRMLPLLRPRVDTAWFLCFETSQWSDPTGEAREIESAKANTLVEEMLDRSVVSEALPGPEPAKPHHQESELLFLCSPCGQHYQIPEPTASCPVCGWSSLKAVAEPEIGPGVYNKPTHRRRF